MTVILEAKCLSRESILSLPFSFCRVSRFPCLATACVIQVEFYAVFATIVAVALLRCSIYVYVIIVKVWERLHYRCWNFLWNTTENGEVGKGEWKIKPFFFIFSSMCSMIIIVLNFYTPHFVTFWYDVCSLKKRELFITIGHCIDCDCHHSSLSAFLMASNASFFF